MENDTTKPSTSKKDSQRTSSGNDLYDEWGRDELASNSETSVSATYSARSRVEIVDARPEPPKPTLCKREVNAPEKKKRGRRSGRIEKRRRSYNRRKGRKALMRRKQVVRLPRAKERRIRKQQSSSTIFTRVSSQSVSRTLGCVHCGHRCRKRYTRRRCTCRRHRNRRMPKKTIVRPKNLKKKPRVKFCARPIAAFSKRIQTGSRSHMLSPMFVNTNSTLQEEVIVPPQTHCEVSPEMIFKSLCVLNLWKQEVRTVFILEYIRRNYPVNNAENELLFELREKLRIASLVGIVTQTKADYWSLCGDLEQRKLTPNHVTLFWEAYADTLRPSIKPKREENLQKNESESPSDKR